MTCLEPRRQDSEILLVAWPPLPLEQFPLGLSDRRRDSRPQLSHALHQGPFRLESRRSYRGEVESANRPGESIHMKICFEEARAVRDREERGLSGVSAESTNAIPRDPDRLHDLGQEFECGDVPRTFAVRIEDVREAVEDANSVRGLLGVRVEDGQAILRGNHSFEGPQIGSRSAHGPRSTELVLGSARTHSLSNALRFRAAGPVA